MWNIIFSFSLVLVVFSCGEGRDTSSPSPTGEDPGSTSPQVKVEDVTGNEDDEDLVSLPETNPDPAVMQPIQLSIKYSHACALLRSSGEIKCWGRGDKGQLGQGDIDNKNLGDAENEMGDNLAAINLGDGRTAKAVSAGWEHTCAILDNDEVKCWGFGNGGRLGQGNEDLIGDEEDEIKNLDSIDLGDGRTAKAVSAGYRHTCAILDNDEVKCWGSGAYGRLGQGSTDNIGDEENEMGDNLAATNLGDGHTAKAVSAGYRHTCVILDNDEVKCWGSGAYGRLGQGSTDNIGDEENEVRDMPTVDLGTGRTAKAISAGWEHTCTILDNDTVKCWGNGVYGRLGYDSNTSKGGNSGEMGENLPIVNLGTGRTAKAISAGWEHTCTILDDDTTKCWGRGDSGELGQGNMEVLGNGEGEMANLKAVNLGEDHTVMAIASGEKYNCALLGSAEVKCWGLGSMGQLGNGKTDNLGDEPSELGEGLPTVALGFNLNP